VIGVPETVSEQKREVEEDSANRLARTFVVLIGPCGFWILHGMGQRPPVFGHNTWIASIEPPLAEWAPDNVLGLEGSALVCASSATGHVRP